MACPVRQVKHDIAVCITGFQNAKAACTNRAFRRACNQAITAMQNARGKVRQVITKIARRKRFARQRTHVAK
jgi:hypothetical protein